MYRRVAILGAGESGVGAALLAHSRGIDCFISDFGSIVQSYRSELDEHGIMYEEKGHTLSSLQEYEIVVKSPGIPDGADIIKELNNLGVEIISELEFAYRLKNNAARIVAITGSNGKTTTTNLIHHLLECSGISALKGGNLGTCFSRLLLQDDCDVYVLEVSSFQLDGIIHFRPDVALITNITPDHLDRYEGSFGLYAAAKMRIIMNQTSEDRFVYFDQQSVIDHLPEQIIPRQTVVSLGDVREQTTISKNFALQGIHNQINISLSQAAVSDYDLSAEVINKALDSFVNDPHRMEMIARIDDVYWINDSKATNVDSTYYALTGVDAPIVWIVGGMDKGNDYSRLINVVKDKVKVIIAMGRDNSKLDRIFGAIGILYYSVSSIMEALTTAYTTSSPGDTVLLSPACASFDLFDNYEDRGEQFTTGVWDLLRSSSKSTS